MSANMANGKPERFRWELKMMNRWRFFEFGIATILLTVGGAISYYGSVDKSVTAGAVLIAGAALFSLGAMTLASALRAFLWHRRMIRHAMPQRSTHSSISGHRGLLHRHR